MTELAVTDRERIAPEPDGWCEVGFPVMGTEGHIVVTGVEAPSAESLAEQVRQLEAMWSRFQPDSELSRLNDAHGRPSVVSHRTAMLLERAVYAWRRTGGRFDPTVLRALELAGYDRSFELLADLAAGAEGGDPVRSPGCGDIEVDLRVDLVRLPIGVAVDPGGIGKGFASDLTAVAAVELGAVGAMVSLGGDLRVAGQAPPDGWEVEVDHHVASPARINLRSGALATSSTLRRRWPTRDRVAHHVIDPRSGRPTTSPAVACSVVAAEAWWAEALSTALLVGFGDLEIDEMVEDLLDDAGALVTLDDGTQRLLGPLSGAFSLDGDRRFPSEEIS